MGFFLSQGEHSLGQEMIQEALEIFKTWNPGYEPKYSMTDCDMAEVNAIKTVYPSTVVFWCDFHVKKAWKERLQRMFQNCTLDIGLFDVKFCPFSNHKNVTAV